MKTVAVMLLLFSATCFGQEEPVAEWKVMPSISVVKLFSVGQRYDMYDVRVMNTPTVGVYPTQGNTNLSATGVSFSARFLNKEFEPFAFTLNAGAQWYRNENKAPKYPVGAYGGYPIPPRDSLRAPMPNVFAPPMYGTDSDHFMSFPIGAGAQFVFPYDKIDKLMFFAGAEGNVSFLSRSIAGRRQVEGGFTLLGGVAIKMVELGVRYSRFAGSNYVGVQAGIRFKQFSVE
jgi:hypothetical protein